MNMKNKELKDLVFELIEKIEPTDINCYNFVSWEINNQYRVNLNLYKDNKMEISIKKCCFSEYDYQFTANETIELTELEYTKIKSFILTTLDKYYQKSLSDITEFINNE